MKFSDEGLKARERFLTPAIVEGLRSVPEGTDPFTTGDTDFPKAFRVGECQVVAPDRTRFEVLIFWKDDTRTEQRSLFVETTTSGDRWRVDKIER